CPARFPGSPGMPGRVPPAPRAESALPGPVPSAPKAALPLPGRVPPAADARPSLDLCLLLHRPRPRSRALPPAPIPKPALPGRVPSAPNAPLSGPTPPALKAKPA
ncbi:hypothetical protein FA13DRAFT_1617438, partial [Coprinellus micaceus]